MARGPVVLLCTDNPFSRIIFHDLRAEVGAPTVVAEDSLSRPALLRRRRRTLGLKTVAGQLLFVGLAVPVLQWRDRARIEEIKRTCGLDDGPMEVVRRVASANSEEAREVLRDLDPALVVVCGTRILAEPTLAAVTCPIVNYHAGITPLYRGVHGGYWALAEGRPDLVGSTLHVVDKGIDTGAVVDQVTFDVTERDSFVTYPYLHVAAALPAIRAVTRRALAGERITGRVRTDLASKLRTHPTLWGYVRRAVTRGVR